MRQLRIACLRPSVLLLLATSPALAAPQDGPPPAAEEAPAARGTERELAPAEERARRLVEQHGNARYAIFNHVRILGEYHQRNSLVELPTGKELLLFEDTIKMFRDDDSDAPVKYATQCGTDERFRPLNLTSSFGRMGSATIQFRQDVILGQNSMTGPVKVDAPEDLVTTMTLLRGLRHQELAPGESVEFPCFVVEQAPRPACFQETTITCVGPEEVVAQGVTYPSRKYTLDAKPRRHVTYWFGEDGQLLRVQEGRQIWELIPPGADGPLPVERDHRGKGRGKGKQRDGDAGDEDEDG